MKFSFSLLLLVPLLVSSCTTQDFFDAEITQEATVTDVTNAGKLLFNLPAPKQQIPVVVYDFQDQTGQFKYNDAFTDYSSAVTKGGLSVLVKALIDTGQGRWFMVAERGGLDNLLKERQIIRTMRDEYLGPDGTALNKLPPLVYGGLMLEGGIVFYDSNILTGGAAAGYFGISASTQYRRDIVTVYLRAVDISSGQVLLAVNSSKTVFSYGVSASLLRYLTYDHLLEADTGFTVNEPAQLAVRQAIETSVYSLLMEGALKNVWSFSNPIAGKTALDAYIERRDGTRVEYISADEYLENTGPGTPVAREPVRNPSRQRIFD